MIIISPRDDDYFSTNLTNQRHNMRSGGNGKNVCRASKWSVSLCWCYACTRDDSDWIATDWLINKCAARWCNGRGKKHFACPLTLIGRVHDDDGKRWCFARYYRIILRANIHLCDDGDDYAMMMMMKMVLVLSVCVWTIPIITVTFWMLRNQNDHQSRGRVRVVLAYCIFYFIRIFWPC